MPKVTCNRTDCLNCEREVCLFDLEKWQLTDDDIKWGELSEREIQAKEKEKKRHANYYLENKTVIDAKQRERDQKRDRKTISHEYYLANKPEIDKRNRLRYRNNSEKYSKKALAHYYEHREEIIKRRKELYRQKKEQKIMTHMERIRALVGNLKNWSWDIAPQFKLEREDAIALQDLAALKEYIAEKEKYKK